MTITNLFEIDGIVLGKYLGYWPDGNKLLNLKSIGIFILCISLEVIPGLGFIVHNINDIARVFMCLHEFVSFLVFVSKIFVYFMNRHNLKDLIDELKSEWLLCKINTSLIFIFILFLFIYQQLFVKRMKNGR